MLAIIVGPLIPQMMNNRSRRLAELAPQLDAQLLPLVRGAPHVMGGVRVAAAAAVGEGWG